VFIAESFQPFVKIPVPERFQSKVVPSAHASAQELYRCCSLKISHLEWRINRYVDPMTLMTRADATSQLFLASD